MRAHRKYVFFATVAAALMVMSVLPMYLNESDAEGGPFVLIDFGNGRTEWSDKSGDTALEALEYAVESFGSAMLYDSSTGFTVDGIVNRTIGVSSTIDVSWRYYVWDGSTWEDRTVYFTESDAIPSAPIALGYYPAGVVPTEKPGTSPLGHAYGVIRHQAVIKMQQGMIWNLVPSNGLIRTVKAIMSSGRFW